MLNLHGNSVNKLKSILSNTMLWVAISSGSQVIALLYTVRSYEKTIQLENYKEMDTMYFSLRQLAYENPEMDDPNTLTGLDKKRYTFYAEMTLNFLETIYDRSKDDKRLRAIWYPVVKEEYAIHMRCKTINLNLYSINTV